MGLKVKDIVDVSSTEGIYTLGVVTNDAYSLVIAYELAAVHAVPHHAGILVYCCARLGG